MIQKNDSGAGFMESRLLTILEASKWLGICERSLWELVHIGKIPTVRIGRLRKFDPSDLVAFKNGAKKVLDVVKADDTL